MTALRSSWPDIARLLREGATVNAAAVAAGADWDTARLVADRLEAGLPIDVPARSLARLERNREIREMAETMSNVAVAARYGMTEGAIRKIIARAALDEIVMSEPVVIAKRPEAGPNACVRVARKSPVVSRDPKPAPIKRSKSKPPKRDPLYLTCSRKHPITKSNRVKGTLNECLVCKRRGVSLPSNLVAARDALIAELEAVIAREVAELTADLRPEMEKAA